MIKHLASRFGLLAIAALAIALAGALTTNGAAAQDPAANFPNRPIRIVVPYAAGGGIDILARLIGQKMSEGLGQPVIIENRPGAGGELAPVHVKNTAPDGYTLLVAASGSMAISPAIKKTLGYSTLRDFAPVGLVASFPLVLVVNKDLPIHSVKEFVDYAKANPAKANYAEPSVAFQLVMEKLKLKTGMALQMIPYKSSTEAMTSVMAGTTIAALVDTGPAAGLIKAGNVRAIAITSAARSHQFPDVPTMTEAGFPDMNISFWSAMFTPAGVAPAIVKKLETELIRVVKSPDVQQRMETLAVIPEGRPSDETRRFIADQIAVYTEVARAAHISLD